MADIVPSKGAEVWGAVYEIAETGISALDRSEGYRPGRSRLENAYERTEIHIEPHGSANGPLAVWTYAVVSKLTPNPKPSREYKQLILEGACSWRLPAPYVQQIEAIETQ